MIGTNITGTKPLGNSANGIFVNGSNSISIGGLGSLGWQHHLGEPGERDLRVRRRGDNGGRVGNLIENNFIGVGGPGGSIVIPNANVGVVLSNSNSNSVVSNVISSNLLDGVLLADIAQSNSILDNKIGTDLSGTKRLGNTADGVFLLGRPPAA